MRRHARALFLACVISALLPVNAEESTHCFTLQFDWRTQIDDSYEEHSVEADFRPSRYGDPSGVYRAAEKQDCDIAGLEPGQIKKFRLAWMRGSAIGVNKPFTATARVDGPPPAGDDTSVTVTRKREGATIEFGVEAVPGRGESEFGLCYPSWEPTVLHLTEREVSDFANLRKSLRVSLEEDACSGKGVVTLFVAARRDAPLEAKPKAPASVARGASVKLDGSDSTGNIKEYRWTFAPAAAGAEINAQAEKSGKEVEVVLLASSRITLEVTDGKQKKQKSMTVTVEPRHWKTTITHLPDEGDLDEKAPLYDPLRPSGGWIGGENVCSIDPPAGPHDTTHILHPEEEGGTWSENGYALAEVSDPNGPYDGFWYTEKWEVRITRRTLINKYIREGGPVIMREMTENFFTANMRLGMPVRQYLQAARDHERKHTTLVEEALAKDDPAKKVEKAYARSQEAVRSKADEILRISEQALSDATKDPLPPMWQGRVMIPNAATSEWIGADTDI
jgi:hypothetical protein